MFSRFLLNFIDIPLWGIPLSAPQVPLPPAVVHDIIVTECGLCDALTAYFELDLDDYSRLSTEPSARPAAWEQAVFPITDDVIQPCCLDNTASCGSCAGPPCAGSGVWLCRGDRISLSASCTESLLQLKIVNVTRKHRSRVTADEGCHGDSRPSHPAAVHMDSKLRQRSEDDTSMIAQSVVYIDRPDLARINDTAHWKMWQSVVMETMASHHDSLQRCPRYGLKGAAWGELSSADSPLTDNNAMSDKSAKAVLDLTHGFPLVGLLSANTGESCSVVKIFLYLVEALL